MVSSTLCRVISWVGCKDKGAISSSSAGDAGKYASLQRGARVSAPEGVGNKNKKMMQR